MKKRNINVEIANIFYGMAEIYQVKQVKWKPQAYVIAAQTLESSPNIEDIYQKGGKKAIDDLPGIGEGISNKIIEYIKTKKIKEYEKLKKSLPRGFYEILKIEGIGGKKAALFYNKLGIKNLKQLEKAAKEHKIRKLPGFKQRAEEKILESISLSKTKSPLMTLKQATIISNKIIKKLKALPEVRNAVIAGSLRRKKSIIKDFDIVVKTSKPEKVIEKFTKMNFIKKVLGKGAKKAIVITKEGINIDLRVADKDSFVACLLYFTGDKQHNIWLRKIAIKKGLKLNEYGLFKGKKRIAGKTEKEIYDKLKIKMISPEKRIGEIK